MRRWPLIGAEHDLEDVLDLDDPASGGVLLTGLPAPARPNLPTLEWRALPSRWPGREWWGCPMP